MLDFTGTAWLQPADLIAGGTLQIEMFTSNNVDSFCTCPPLTGFVQIEALSVSLDPFNLIVIFDTERIAMCMRHRYCISLSDVTPAQDDEVDWADPLEVVVDDKSAMTVIQGTPGWTKLLEVKQLLHFIWFLLMLTWSAIR